jgi:chromosome segregation ATPase
VKLKEERVRIDR